MVPDNLDEQTPLILTTPRRYILIGRLNVNAEEAARELSLVWGWVLAAGILNLLLGILALFCPITTSDVVLSWIAVALLLVGAIHITGLCYAEQGLKGATSALGVVQIILAILAFKDPFESLMALTIMIAVVFMVEGVFRIYLAMQNHDIPNWRVLFLNGICNVAFSAIVIAALPYSSLYTLGILVGVNLITIGTARITIGIMARSASIQQNEIGEEV